MEKSVASILDQFKRTGESWLNKLETVPAPPMAMIPYSPAMISKLERYSVGGSKCDCCGKKRNDVEGVLLRCTRCRRAYYCSRDCQQHSWKAGHKKCCCKPDDFRVKDELRFEVILNRISLGRLAGSLDQRPKAVRR